MLALDATTKSLEIKLAGAIATTQCPFVAAYVDLNQTTFAATASGEADGTTNGATAVTVLAAPSATTTRKLNYLSLVNVDTAPVVAAVQVNNAATKRIVFQATLAVGDQLEFTDASGWRVLDSAGNTKTSASVSGILPAANFPALTGDVTTVAGALATTIGAGKVTNAMLAGSIAAAKLVGSDIVLTESQITSLVADLALKAALASPALTGTPTAPTAALATNTTQIATTAFVLANAPSGAVDPGVCEGRLTLSAGVPVTTADVTGATSIKWTPYKGANIALYSGSAWVLRAFVETSLALGTLTAALPYDVFAYDNAGTLALELLAWTNATTRATALVLQDGVYCKTGALTRRYLGTFYTTATTTTEDSFAKRYVWNYYNRVPRVMKVLEPTSSWAYTSSFRQARGSTANQLDCVIGVAEVEVCAEVWARAVSDQLIGLVPVAVAIGEDSTSTPSPNCLFDNPVNLGVGAYLCLGARLRVYPSVGRHSFVWLEVSAAIGTTTWFGVNTFNQTGIVGSVAG
jgi:hypothetical protein